MTKLDATIENGRVTFNSGQIIARVHSPTQCLGDVCPIHNPSDHALRGEQLFFNGTHMVRRVGAELFIDPDDYYFRNWGKAILRNSAICKLCGDAIESIHRHHMATCSCGEISVDGGQAYFRASARNFDNFISTSVSVGYDNE